MSLLRFDRILSSRAWMAMIPLMGKSELSAPPRQRQCKRMSMQELLPGPINMRHFKHAVKAGHTWLVVWYRCPEAASRSMIFLTVHPRWLHL